MFLLLPSNVSAGSAIRLNVCLRFYFRARFADVKREIFLMTLALASKFVVGFIASLGGFNWAGLSIN